MLRRVNGALLMWWSFSLFLFLMGDSIDALKGTIYFTVFNTILTGFVYGCYLVFKKD